MDRYEYTLRVANNRTTGVAVAYLGDESPDNPLQGVGATPLEAVRALCETIREWPLGGSERWLSTPDGMLLVAQLTPRGLVS